MNRPFIDLCAHDIMRKDCEKCRDAKKPIVEVCRDHHEENCPKCKDKRPSFTELYMQLARGLSQRSTCARLKVGCVIASTDYRYVHGVGYNGNYTGGPNGCDSTTPGACGCLHAEDNAVINCTAARSERKIVLCTHLPCVICAKRIINLGGVQKVVYGEEYRSTDSIELFKTVGIKLWKWGNE